MRKAKHKLPKTFWAAYAGVLAVVAAMIYALACAYIAHPSAISLAGISLLTFVGLNIASAPFR